MKCSFPSFKSNIITSQNVKPQNPNVFEKMPSDILYTTPQKFSSKTNSETKKLIALGLITSFTALSFSMLATKKTYDLSIKFRKFLIEIKETTTRNIQRQSDTTAGKELSKQYLKNKIWESVAEAPSLEDLSLTEEISDRAKKIIRTLTDPESIKRRGGKVSNSILLYGPPGTGKTSFAKAIAKEFPDSLFASIDIAAMGSEYVSVTERNFNNAINDICEVAKENAAKKIFVFLDEIDSVMMVDNSLGNKRSNDILNVLKKGMTEKFAQLENVIVIGATNLTIDESTGRTIGGKVLDKPMLDRFKNLVLVDLPTAEQLKQAILKHYQNPRYDLVDVSLKDGANKNIQTLSEFLAKHGISFRTLEGLYQEAASSIQDEQSKINILDIINAIKAKSTELKIEPKEIKTLLSNMIPNT